MAKWTLEVELDADSLDEAWARVVDLPHNFRYNGAKGWLRKFYLSDGAKEVMFDRGVDTPPPYVL